MKKFLLISIIKECYSELLNEVISNPDHFKITIEDYKYNTSDSGPIFTAWTGYGKILIPGKGWKTITRGTRRPMFTWLIGNKKYSINISKYLKQRKDIEDDKTINETLDSVIYSNEVVGVFSSIDELLKNYSGDYFEFINRGSAKFFDYGNHFKFSFNLIFPRKKVEFKTSKECFQTISKALDFYNDGKEGEIYGEGKTKIVAEDEKNFILLFTVRGGKEGEK